MSDMIQQSKKIAGQVANIACYNQPSYGIILQDLFRFGLQLLCIYRVIQEQRILFQYSRHNVLPAVLGKSSLGKGL